MAVYPPKFLLANAKNSFFCRIYVCKICLNPKILLDFKDVKKNISQVIDRISPHDSKRV
ncbi:MAG: hypothetical protein CM15mP117_23990 [Alphaproteobacteria bacterium]|nr:MAG: hypothetical protein CM15mP117_23990 [Alphaproteobacteria bacterium]